MVNYLNHKLPKMLIHMECLLKVDYREQLINLIILIHEIIIKLYLSKIMMLKQQQISLIVIEGKKTSLFERILRNYYLRLHLGHTDAPLAGLWRRSAPQSSSCIAGLGGTGPWPRRVEAGANTPAGAAARGGARWRRSIPVEVLGASAPGWGTDGALTGH